MESIEHTRILIEKARKGDRPSFETLFESARSRLEAHVRFRLEGPLHASLDVEDVLQETFLRGVQSIERFRWEGEGSCFRWLAGIAANVIREARGREKRRPRDPLDSRIPAKNVSQSRALRREERSNRFQESLCSLSPDHRRVIELAKLEKLPIKEVARRMDRTPTAISKLLMRAVDKLRESFGDTESLSLPESLLFEPILPEPRPEREDGDDER